ncbi:MAG: cytidyltransferase [Bacillota bacterium]
MKKDVYARLLHDINESLLDPEFLSTYRIEKSFLKKHIDSHNFKARLIHIVENNDYSCSAIHELCKDILDELLPNLPSADRLPYLYYFALNKSFPHAVPVSLASIPVNPCMIYLKLLRTALHYEKRIHDQQWINKNTIQFLSAEEERHLESPSEYRKFRRAFKDEYIFEMMKLSEEVTGHQTLDHICGVHFVAMHIGRQLFQCGIPIDLGRVSGGAAGHDIGKYGCKESEYHRVPYLHYYYTDYWFKKHDITYIGHIAVNHSTWDLELENLPLESLVLIYADFRVKSIRDEDKRKRMHIYSLSDAFDVVLNKLDNLTPEKTRRYQKVYMKLKDFEDFMINLGVLSDVEAPIDFSRPIEQKKKHYALMQCNEVVDNMKYLSIKHNIRLMYKLRNEHALNEILESARNEKDWKNLREYIRLFEEYSTYLTQRQKLIMIKFLYDQLIHPEDDIRRHCAELIGKMIAMFDEDYRKEVPKDGELSIPEITSSQLLDKYFNSIIYPDHKTIPLHRQWIGYSSSIMVSQLFSVSPPAQRKIFRETLLKYFKSETYADEDISLYLLQTAKYIPLEDYDPSMDMLLTYIMEMAENQNPILRLSAWEIICDLLPILPSITGLSDVLRKQFSKTACMDLSMAEKFLQLKIMETLGVSEDTRLEYVQACKFAAHEMSDIYLKNLKTDTHWTVKNVQVDILLKTAIENPDKFGFHTAMHFCNLLKVSGMERVRNRAGAALVKLIPYLPPDQRNDIAVELLRALEIEGYQFVGYIPYYLGQIMLSLPFVELQELINDLILKIKHSNPQLCSLLLKTIGVFLVHFLRSEYLSDTLHQNQNQICIKLLQVILNAFADYNPQIKQAAFSVLGKDIFGSKFLVDEQKQEIFQLIAKKILTLVTDMKEYELQFLSNSATFNHIYRFISDYSLQQGNICLYHPNRIAFFSGTFDPFSLGHKEVVKAIKNLGFEVYLAVDEFSWLRQALPNLIRKNIINMSIADELGVYIYPEDFPTNLGNPKDLATLKGNFPDADVYIVAGSDVLQANGYYLEEKKENSVHYFPHIIFERSRGLAEDASEGKLNNILQNLHGEIIRLKLPSTYENVSSSLIRDYIDENRDVSSFIDPLAQKYIYELGLYQREPQFKTVAGSVSIDIEVLQGTGNELLHDLAHTFCKDALHAYENLLSHRNKPFARLLLLRDRREHGEILGFTAFHWLKSSSLYNELKDRQVSNFLYDHAVGNMILIDGIYTKPNARYSIEKLEQILLTETLAYNLSRDFEYAIYHHTIDEDMPASTQELSENYGFIQHAHTKLHNPVMTVNMNKPCTLYLDIRSIIKEPYSNLSTVKEVILGSRKKLQKALTALYPGQLILAFDRSMLYETLIKKICEENDVSTDVTAKELGPAICVPFGHILHKSIVPNTVTKSLHTEKYFYPDVNSYQIGPFPYYLDLDIQLKIIQAFNRPVILVDDLLSKGYRINALDPLLRKQNIDVQKIIVGILSNRGKELMEIQGRNVDAAYHIPKLRAWFNESAMYPFIGGDALWRGTYPQRNLLPSVNLILPYTFPSFLKGTSKEAIYQLSMVSIQNAVDIMTTLEEEYQNIHERALTLSSLGNVLMIPRCPDHGNDMEYNLNVSPSHYLMNDIELLKRIEHFGIK